MAALQTLQVVRGVAGAALLFVIAGPYSRLLGVEDLIWPYQLLALTPLLTGLVNLDLYRPQRHGDFKTYARWQMNSPFASVVLLGVLLLIYDDWRLGLYTTLGAQLFACIASHLMAERRMRLSVDWNYVREALVFGWPLFLNAILLYVILNGDRIIVSNQLGLEDLAFFTIALGVAQIPVSVLAKAHQYIFLPDLSRKRDDAHAFDGAVRLAIQSRMAMAIGMVLVLALIGPDLITLVYGEKYAGIGALAIWTGLFHGMRTLKGAPGTIAVALAETRNPLYANLLRVLSLPVAFLAVQQGASLTVVVIIATVAEFLAYLLSMWLLKRTAGRLPAGVWSATALTLTVYLLVALDVVLFPPAPGLLQSFHAAQIGLVLAGIVAILGMGTLRSWLWRRVSARLRGRG